MDLRRAALLIPALAAGALLAVRGGAVLGEPGAAAFAALAVTGAAGLLALLAAARAEARRAPASLPPAAEALLRGTATLLGDAALAFDARGGLLWANASAIELSGYAPEALLGRTRDALGAELGMLLRGLERGPAFGRVALHTPAGEVTVEAAAVRVPGRRAVDVAVLRRAAPGAAAGAREGRPEARAGGGEAAGGPVRVDDADLVAGASAPRPPPLPVTAGDGARRAAAPAARELAAVREELGGPLARASAAAATLRLLLPGGANPAAEPLGRLERELRRAQEALSALTAPLPPPSPRAVDLDAALGEALAAARLPPGIRVDRLPGGERALADPEQLQQALLQLVRLAAEAMPAGGVLAVRSVRRGAAVEIDLADTGAARAAPPGMALALARRLLAAQGGRVERAAVAGRGALSRVSLRAAPAALAERSAVL